MTRRSYLRKRRQRALERRTRLVATSRQQVRRPLQEEAWALAKSLVVWLLVKLLAELAGLRM